MSKRLTARNDLPRRSCVQARGRLIEHEDPGTSYHGASDCYTTLLSSRDAARQRCTDVVVGDVLKAESDECAVDVLLNAGCVGWEAIKDEG